MSSSEHPLDPMVQAPAFRLRIIDLPGGGGVYVGPPMPTGVRRRWVIGSREASLFAKSEADRLAPIYGATIEPTDMLPEKVQLAAEESSGPSQIDAMTLDPGVRSLVMWLRSLGYETTDSGDGVSKIGPVPTPAEMVRLWARGVDAEERARIADDPESCLRSAYMAGVEDERRRVRDEKNGEPPLDVPHVHIRPVVDVLEPEVGMAKCARKLEAELICAGVAVECGMIQATYDPADDSTVVSIYGVTDSMLRRSLQLWNEPGAEPFASDGKAVTVGEDA